MMRLVTEDGKAIVTEDGRAIVVEDMDKPCRCTATHEGPCKSAHVIIDNPTILGSSPAVGQLVRIGYTGKDELGFIMLEPDVYIEIEGKRATLSGTMLDSLAFYARRRSECTVGIDGTVITPPGFEEAKRAVIDAKPT